MALVTLWIVGLVYGVVLGVFFFVVQVAVVALVRLEPQGTAARTVVDAFDAAADRRRVGPSEAVRQLPVA